MPEPGLSLVGLMPEDVAQHYLNRCCFLPNKSVKSIRKYWSDAKGTIGPPTARAGLPDIQEMGSEHDQYLDRVRANPAFVKALEGMPYSFKWVEIDPLLCFQFHLETNRSANLCKSVDDGPTVDDMLPICLPEHLEEIPYDVMEAGNGKLRVRAESLNLRPCLQGDISTLLADNPNKIKAAGIAFGPAAPFFQVVRFRGKSYIKNGVHRAYGLGKSGATHVPCLFLEARDYRQVAVQPRLEIFQQDLLESANPPTIGHFVQDRAYAVTLRRGFMNISVRWSASIEVEAA
jgi:hypothetical protein